jgi:DNA-binding transcriptional MocR family regulator
MADALDDLRSLALAAAPGDRLPSVRELCARHGVGPATVQRAVATLATEGLLVAYPGRGTFAADPDERPTAADGDLDWQAPALGPGGVDPGGLDALLSLPGDGVIPLSTGFVDPSLQPLTLLSQAAGRAARRGGSWGRQPVEGSEELRAWFAREAGGAHTAADVIVTGGSQAALGTTFRALGRPGDPIAVESPTYLGALAAARGAGLVPVGVPVDGDGIRVDLLERALGRGARLVYLQPRHSNPTGVGLAADRRAAVLAAASRAGAFVVEDDYARDITFEGPDLPPLAAADPDGHVVYVRSLTKSAAPGLRVGMVAARGGAGHRLRAARVVDDFFVSGLLQGTVLELVSSPGWPRHLRRLNAELSARRDALLVAVAKHLPAWEPFAVPAGGLGIWLRLGEGLEESELARLATEARVQVSLGRPWFAGDPAAAFVRLSYAGADAATLGEGVRRLARAIRG